MRPRRSLAAATLVAAIAGVTVFTSAAAAQTNAGDEVMSPAMTEQALPPSCVAATNQEATFTSRGTVTVDNLCGRMERVKVLIAFGSDSQCFTLQQNGIATHRYTFPARFDGLERC